MKKIPVISSILWLGLIAISGIWNVNTIRENNRALAIQAGRSFLNQIVVSRAWNAGHGGVYVPVTEDTQPNEYLIDPMRDIKINDELTLTKINPAYMTRQISEISREENSIQFHITSLNPIRPENKPNELEYIALLQFDEGIDEFHEIIVNQTGEKTAFYMAPLVTEKSCLQCHAQQGYKEGDIRGGIGVYLPVIPERDGITVILLHSLLGITGFFGIVFFSRKLNLAYNIIYKQAVFDALTNIPNRHAFGTFLSKEFKRSKREKQSFSLIMCDIDFFKVYNDTFGHLKGDECLQRVAEAIQSSLMRPADFCARYGGEEFVVILPNTELAGAMHVAEAIRKKVSNLEIPTGKGDTLHLTISAGAAHFTAEMLNEVTTEEIIHAADKALFRAKHMGRNRVEHNENLK